MALGKQFIEKSKIQTQTQQQGRIVNILYEQQSMLNALELKLVTNQWKTMKFMRGKNLQ